MFLRPFCFTRGPNEVVEHAFSFHTLNNLHYPMFSLLSYATLVYSRILYIIASLHISSLMLTQPPFISSITYSIICDSFQFSIFWDSGGGLDTSLTLFPRAKERSPYCNHATCHCT